MSCSGARSKHLIEEWDEIPPQLDAVREETQLVAITIGGNDLNYVGNLLAASCSEGERLRSRGVSVPCPALRQTTEQSYTDLESNLIILTDAIGQRAPQARIVFVQYLTLIPQTLCSKTRLSNQEAADAQKKAQRLADVIPRVAERGGASVLQVNDMSTNRTPCDDGPLSHGFEEDFDFSSGVPWHPNEDGMEFIAESLEQMWRL